jgi:ribosomal protein S18 acetylase RimI-like enzyme
MVADDSLSSAARARAVAWHRAAHAAVCDVVEPWAHGTIVRATRYPDYYDFNVVRVEDDPRMSAEALAAVADEALDGMRHRRVDFEVIEAADGLRGAFVERGWRAMRLVWMRHETAGPPRAAIEVTEVPYDDVDWLRLAWHEENHPGQEQDLAYHRQSREVALLRNAQVFAARDGETVVGYAQLERAGTAAEITQVFVHPEHRGNGRGTAITSAAIDAAGGVSDLWICADDEDRPKELYGRLGFRTAWTSMEFQLEV